MVNPIKQIILFCVGIAVLTLFACHTNPEKKACGVLPKEHPEMAVPTQKLRNLTEEKLEALGLTDVQTLDSTLLVSLKYATTDNFTQKKLYPELTKAYLQPEAAKKLAKAQQYLQELYPDRRLLVYDAVRPLNVQKEMYESVRNTVYHRYVAEPGRTGLHNYAAAVDLTIADANGIPLDMGTPFDFFGKAAGTSDEEGLIRQGLLTKQQLENRRLLRKVMVQAGFQTIRGEWWHFNHCSLSVARNKYVLIDSF